MWTKKIETKNKSNKQITVIIMVDMNLSISISTLNINGLNTPIKNINCWEAKAGGSGGQEIETILVNMVKPCL